jgi:hypothetical protein
MCALVFVCPALKHEHVCVCVPARACVHVCKHKRAIVWVCIQARVMNKNTRILTYPHAHICTCMLMHPVGMLGWGTSADCVLVSCPAGSTCPATRSAHWLWANLTHSRRLCECTSPHALRNCPCAPSHFKFQRRAVSKYFGS